MSLNSILNTATSGLQSNQTALRVTSNNIANVNTQGYHRRVVDFGPQLTAGKLQGVQIDAGGHMGGNQFTQQQRQ